MFSLLGKSLRYNLSAHAANLPNLIAGACGMVINNIIFLLGMWGMLFAGKTGQGDLLYYYLALNSVVMSAWGAINFFFGGWIDLGELIVNGHFESKLSTPRHPLLLVGMHALHPSALGDLLMGLFGMCFLMMKGHPEMAIRSFAASFLVIIALFALYVFSGSLAFFVSRGNMIALLVRELTLSMSMYPMSKIFPTGLGRILLLLTPAAAVSILPMEWVEGGSLLFFAKMLGGVLAMLTVAMLVYTLGVKRFQSLSLIGSQS